MGSAYKNEKDVALFLPDDTVVYTGVNGKVLTVKYFKEHIKDVVGVVNFKTEQPTRTRPERRYISHRSNEPRARRFTINYVPLKFSKRSELVIFDSHIFVYPHTSLFPKIEKPKVSYGYTREDLYKAIRTVKEFSNLPFNRGELSCETLIQDLQNGMGAVELQNKYSIGKNRGPVLDVCFAVKVATNNKLDLLTDKMKDVGVCTFSKELYEAYPNYFTITMDK